MTLVNLSIVIYVVAGEKATGRGQIGRFVTNFADHTYRVQHVVINMDNINMINNYTKIREMKTQSIRKDHGFGILVKN